MIELIQSNNQTTCDLTSDWRNKTVNFYSRKICFQMANHKKKAFQQKSIKHLNQLTNFSLLLLMRMDSSSGKSAMLSCIKLSVNRLSFAIISGCAFNVAKCFVFPTIVCKVSIIPRLNRILSVYRTLKMFDSGVNCWTNSNCLYIRIYWLIDILKVNL